MLYDFEKLLNDNDVQETDTSLPKTVVRLIEKFRSVQKKMEGEESPEEKEKLKNELDELDSKIMKTLPDHFDIEDEEEVKRKAELAARAKKAGIAETSTEQEIVAAEKAKADQEEQQVKDKKKLAARAKAVGLPEDSTEKAIAAAEKSNADKAAKEEADKEIARKKQEEEDSKPATTNEGALEKLFKKGKKTVTTADLKSAGFDTGFFSSPIGPHGCRSGKFKIYRETPSEDSFELSQVG